MFIALICQAKIFHTFHVVSVSVSLCIMNTFVLVYLAKLIAFKISLINHVYAGFTKPFSSTC